MENKSMADSYYEALASMIITHAESLENKNKAGAFISLFLQSIYKKYGDAAMRRVREYMKKELIPEALLDAGSTQTVKNGTGVPLYKQSPFLQLIRKNMIKAIKRKQEQAKLKK
ncbi:MAG: hypothetical protein HQL01_08470 [Nitrospirae bacterium]|nr:hypothetical protein [Nitrospirota bacterium]